VQKLGLTGSIASGKSTVLKAFAELGVPTFSSDAAVHELYEGEAVAPIEALFPGVERNGAIDRAALAEKVLGNPEQLSRLEAIVHPLVRARIARFLDDAEKAGAFLAVVDIPLLFEGGFDYGLDAVAVTVTDEPQLRQRALSRPGMTVDKLDAILARQLPQDEKKRRASFVFDTSGPLQRTVRAVRALVEAFRRNPNGIQ
jgi:dephospho-CoA kinase